MVFIMQFIDIGLSPENLTDYQYANPSFACLFIQSTNRMAKLGIPRPQTKLFSLLWAISWDAINTRNLAKVEHGRLNSLVIPSKYFAFLLWEFSQQQTGYALVEHLKKTKIQVRIWLQHDIKRFKLICSGKFFLKDVISDKLLCLLMFLIWFWDMGSPL